MQGIPIAIAACYVYDPECRLDHPAAIESDLSTDERLRTVVVSTG